MKVKSESEVSQLRPTLSDPMDCSLPGFAIGGIFQARELEWGVIVFSASTCIKFHKWSDYSLPNLSFVLDLYLTLAYGFLNYVIIYTLF